MSCAGQDGTAGHSRGQHDSIDNLSPSLWLLAWLGSALAEVCQKGGYINTWFLRGNITSVLNVVATQNGRLCDSELLRELGISSLWKILE